MSRLPMLPNFSMETWKAHIFLMDAFFCLNGVVENKQKNCWLWTSLGHEGIKKAHLTPEKKPTTYISYIDLVKALTEAFQKQEMC